MVAKETCQTSPPKLLARANSGTAGTSFLRGPKMIYLYRGYRSNSKTSNSSRDTEERLWSSDANEPDIIDFNWVKVTLLGPSYGSLNSWPGPAEAFASLSQGNGTLAAILKQVCASLVNHPAVRIASQASMIKMTDEEHPHNVISSEPLSSSFDPSDPILTLLPEEHDSSRRTDNALLST
ncbi:uncharacterized protein MYCFIDRAFT_177769 [Pseudocercospora fijiensis CIRAD86]|uniref:Uncharacterized protein n=1 Tax=Pseudocercospora fijiensis (strain CIRAD86) TaxID=383855 RepID=M3A384_PSEFD|nr:uncharacterized protein MYCFIDRAFT_177769 [Pseudocercospora fijiensis CIRAD86]EME79106.1 hypothetical protein MYCFIDRAFT_177769 [Pseudocercospora fijiensis CIRAD86]